MTLKDLHNPKKITGMLISRKNGKMERWGTEKDTAIQETKGRIEIWQQLDKDRITLVKGFLKRDVTFYEIKNKEFVPKD